MATKETMTLTTGRNTNCRLRGFTLLELILVMVIVCTAFAVAAPSLRGFSLGARTKDAATQILALTQWARSQAVVNARVYRFNINPQIGTYWLTAQDGQGFLSLGTEFGRLFRLPEECRIELTTTFALGQDFVDFYPNGRATPALIRLTDRRGNEFQITSPSPAERFRIVEAWEGRAG